MEGLQKANWEETTHHKRETQPPWSKQINDDVCGKIRAVHGRSLQLSPQILGFFSLLVHFCLEPFLCISKDVYEEAIRSSTPIYITLLFLKMRSPSLGLVFWVVQYSFLSTVFATCWTFSTKGRVFLSSSDKFSFCPTLISRFIPSSEHLWPQRKSQNHLT